jgi:phospholipid/cholesterol/gamma-HCH transport system permease protein
VIAGLVELGRFGAFAAAVGRRLATPPWSLRDAAAHLWVLATRCLLPVVAVVFPAGMVLALQGLGVFGLFGAQRMLSALVSVAVFRELSPVLASVLVAAQGGSAFAAELGSMRIREELDATAVMAVDPLRVHVVPRVAAALVATPLLNLVGSLAGVAGAWLVAVAMKGENGGIFWANLWALTKPVDLWGSLLKTAVFGAIIGLVATWKGFTATGGAAGVGKAVNDTVVIAVTGFVVANYFLTSAIFGALR